jgi:hypothetical protein
VKPPTRLLASCSTIRTIGPKHTGRIVAGWADQKVIREIMRFLCVNGTGTSAGGERILPASTLAPLSRQLSGLGKQIFR